MLRRRAGSVAGRVYVKGLLVAEASALRDVADLAGAPMFDRGAFQRSGNDSFDFHFVDPTGMNEAERAVCALVGHLSRMDGIDLWRVGVDEVLVSETMRLNEQGTEVVGLFDWEDRRVVIKRDKSSFLGNSPARVGARGVPLRG